MDQDCKEAIEYARHCLISTYMAAIQFEYDQKIKEILIKEMEYENAISENYSMDRKELN
jgi:hypothetical protein